MKVIYKVNTETKGVLEFKELPPSTYFAMGSNGSIAGQAYYFTFDSGTCLIPITKNGKNVVTKNADYYGKSITEIKDFKL